MLQSDYTHALQILRLFFGALGDTSKTILKMNVIMTLRGGVRAMTLILA